MKDNYSVIYTVEDSRGITVYICSSFEVAMEKQMMMEAFNPGETFCVFERAMFH